MAQEASDKLGTVVTIDVMRPLQAFDAGGRASASDWDPPLDTKANKVGFVAGSDYLGNFRCWQ
jgi:hypothetical protein